MMKKLPLILFALLTLSLSAQDTETVTIDWSFGSNSNVTPSDAPTNADRTIEVGDTVIWNYYATGTHTVTSLSGSTETWDSGFIASGTNVTYSRTFTQIGTNPYECTPHPGSMFGTITVVAEGTLSTPTFENNSTFSIAPNPSKNWLNITLPSYNSELNVEVFDVLGKRVHKGTINQIESAISVSNWNKGVYLVRVSNDKFTQTKRFIKQ